MHESYQTCDNDGHTEDGGKARDKVSGYNHQDDEREDHSNGNSLEGRSDVGLLRWDVYPSPASLEEVRDRGWSE